MTKKRLIILGIMVIVLIAVGVTTVLLLSRTTAQQEDETALIVVAEIDATSVTGMEITTGGSVTSLVKEDGVWYYDGNKGESADQLLTESTVTNLSYMYADEIMRQSVNDLSPYGLDPAAMTIQLKQPNSETHTYHFGIATSDKSGVFFQMEGDPRLYVFDVEKYNQVLTGVNNLKNLSMDIDAKALTEIRLMRSGGDRTEMRLKRIPESQRAGTETWMLEAPVQAVANESAIQLVEVLFSPARFAGYVSDDMLPEYGIGKDSPYLTLTDSAGKTVTLTFGNQTEEGTYYCTASDRDGVYTAYEGMQELLNMDTLNAIAPAVFPVSADHLPGFTLTVGDEVYDLSEKNGAYALNGHELNAQGAADIGALMESITVNGLCPDADTTDIIASFKMGDIVIGFSEYRNDYLAASMNGTPYAYTKIENLALLVDLLDSDPAA